MSLGGTSSQLVKLEGQMSDLLKIWKIWEEQKMERNSCGRSWPSEKNGQIPNGIWPRGNIGQQSTEINDGMERCRWKLEVRTRNTQKISASVSTF